MIYKQPTIYNCGITSDEVKKIVSDEMLKNLVWENITDKLGQKSTASISTNIVNIYYNRNLGLFKISCYTYFTSSTSGTKTIFEFNNDIPGTPNKCFSAECVSALNGTNSGATRVYPFSHTDPNFSRKISVHGSISYIENFTGMFFTNINTEMYNAFNEYIDSH